MLALLESAMLPGADALELVEQAQGEVDQIRELIDDILFLSELESGHEVVGLGTDARLPDPTSRSSRASEDAGRARRRHEMEVGGGRGRGAPRSGHG